MKTIDPVAAVALSIAMDHVREALRPWTVTDSALERLKEEFVDDFNDIFAKPDAYADWAAPLRRLFRSVGAAAALIAESDVLGTRDETRDITFEELTMASKLVEVAICPRFPERLRACRLAPFLKGEAETRLVDLVQKIFKRYRDTLPPYPPA
jgi:hypothetical protein